MVTKSKASVKEDELPPTAVVDSVTVTPPVEDTTAPSNKEEVPVVNGDSSAAVVDEKKGDKVKKGSKVKKEKVVKKEGEVSVVKKPKKKIIPRWATISVEAGAKLLPGSLGKGKTADFIIEAIKMCADSKGSASASSIRSMVMSENPDTSKVMLKKTMAKLVDRGAIVQVKGKGFSGSFKLSTGKKAEKAEANAAKGKGKGTKGPYKEPLENLFPNVFTWACNPKEASVGFIKKYLVANYPELELGEDCKHYKKALDQAEKSGQLDRLTGKGFTGTFQLVDGASLTGAKFEEAFMNACIAMNEPKDISVNCLRDYLSVYHAEYETDNKPKVLKKALERAVESGWLQQISGKGFTGKYKLMYPYYPSPKQLWGKDFQEEKEVKSSPKKVAAKKAVVSDDDDDVDDDSDDDGEEVYVAKKRGAPTPRKAAGPKAKKVKAEKKITKKIKPVVVVAKKSKPSKKSGKGQKKK